MTVTYHGAIRRARRDVTKSKRSWPAALNTLTSSDQLLFLEVFATGSYTFGMSFLPFVVEVIVSSTVISAHDAPHFHTTLLAF